MEVSILLTTLPLLYLQWNAPVDGWGNRYGGVSHIDECNRLPAQLQAGCRWRFNWFRGADNPLISFKRVRCPSTLTDRSGCIRKDDENALLRV
jgi:hypothetical protein